MTRFKHLAPTFAKHAVSLDERGTHPKLKKKRPAPVSLRLNEAELAALRKAASGRSMNGYIRERLFGDGAAISVSQPVSEDYEALARVLGALGKTDIYTNLAAISLALEERRMLASTETETAVIEACDTITVKGGAKLVH